MNKNLYYKYLISLLTLVLFYSCYNLEDRKKLARAQTLLERDHADSAVNSLDSIYLPERMGKEYYMQYLVTHVQAKYKAYRNIKNDTAVLEAVRYYEQKKDNPIRIAEANYSAGVVRMEQGMIESAIHYFKAASENADLTNQYTLQGLIYENLGYLYQEELLQEQAIAYYKKALFAYKNEANTGLKQLNALSFLANNYITNHQPDSALIYLDRALVIADSIKNEYFQALIRNNAGTTYQLKKNFKRSTIFLKEALLYNPDSVLVNKINLNLTDNYLQLNDNESLKTMIAVLKQSLKTSTDLYYQSALMDLLMKYEVRQGNFAQALIYSQENNHIQASIFNENQAQALIEAEKKFDYTRKENETKLARQQQRITLLVFSLLLIFVIGTGLIIRFRAKQKQKMKVIRLEYEKATQEVKNQEMKERLELYVVTNDQYKLLIRSTAELHRVIHDTVQAGEATDKSNRFRKIKKALSETEFTVLENMGNMSRSFLMEQKLIPTEVVEKISNTDTILLLMLYNKENRNDITALLSTNPHALTQRISRLKVKLKPLIKDTEFQLFFQ